MTSAQGRLVETELAALALDVPAATIRQWSKRGKLTRYGTARRALYDLAECQRLAMVRAEQGDTRGTACTKIGKVSR